MNAQEALKKLQAGNARYVNAVTNDGNVSQAVREHTYNEGQHPYAVVLTCSDSRVVPEHVFMCGLGEIFTIRVAGNIVTNTQLASVVYAASHLGSPLVVVLGHTHCGAIEAAMNHAGHGCLSALTSPIEKAIGNEKDSVKACELNVQASVAALKSNPEVQELIDRGLKVVGAIYDIETGVVTFLREQ